MTLLKFGQIAIIDMNPNHYSKFSLSNGKSEYFYHYGKSYIEAVNATGGIAQSITDPFSNILKAFGKAISGLATRFKIKHRLNPEDLKNLKVTVDGTEVHYGHDWTFHSVSNSISFKKPLNPKSKVEVVFSSFKVDPNPWTV